MPSSSNAKVYNSDEHNRMNQRLLWTQIKSLVKNILYMSLQVPQILNLQNCMTGAQTPCTRLKRWLDTSTLMVTHRQRVQLKILDGHEIFKQDVYRSTLHSLKKSTIRHWSSHCFENILTTTSHYWLTITLKNILQHIGSTCYQWPGKWHY